MNVWAVCTDELQMQYPSYRNRCAEGCCGCWDGYKFYHFRLGEIYKFWEDQDGDFLLFTEEGDKVILVDDEFRAFFKRGLNEEDLHR
jgi:hypothetical protein